MRPAYLQSYQNGRLDQAITQARGLLESCRICPRKCGVNRLKGEEGFCKTGCLPRVFSFMAHHGEEPPLSGTLGSGAIFFANCNMACVYCQNYEFSQLGQGREVSAEGLAEMMLQLQGMCCHNINLVTPTHIMPQILQALKSAVEKGLHLPLCYNTSGYESTEALKLLEGIVDIYLPDMRYGDAGISSELSSAPDYPEYNQRAVKEMHRQVGVAQINKEEGVIERGVIIRHLVLPDNQSGTEKIMRFIAEEVSVDTYISLMSQYLPLYQASKFKGISRRLKESEYAEAKKIMQRYGLSCGWVQESYGEERFAGVNIKPALKKDGG
ncbi:MAG: radical SAM protein [Omnitrophica WOR_2 bacterium RIFCSPLOWO2_12_FULL_51_8]|nr:MAG: radical SAM protein [Omnitrophica WOR_2 bacterium RIFCSPLOWO2_12_FULL_51_8]